MTQIAQISFSRAKALTRGNEDLFFLTRRREGAKKTNTRKNGGMSCRYAAIHAADRKTRGRDLCVRPAVLCGWSIFVEAVCVFDDGHSW